jgi:hypothetical protein
MDLNLAAYYDPNAGQEDLEKTAEAELFVKLATQQGIDVTQMSDEDVTQLYGFVFNKTAEEESKGEEHEEHEEHETAKEEKVEEEKKKESAAHEHQTKLAFAKEAAQADELGVRMARAYVAELNKIGSELLAKQAADAGEAPPEGTDKEAAMPEGLAKALGKVKEVGKKVGDSARSGAFDAGSALNRGAGKVKEVAGKGADFAKKHKTTIGVGAGAASVGAGAGYAAGRKKESSATDQLALEQAVKIAFDAGFDPEEAATLVTSRFNLGLEESTKLGSTWEEQVNIRALEYLEAVGYPVNWDQA